MLGDPDGAEDATQETFIRFIHRFDPERGRPTDLLDTIARNLCRDELRRRRRAPLDMDAPATLGSEDPAEIVIRGMLLRQLWAELSAREQRLLALQLQGVSCEDAAQRLGVSLGTITSGLSRARKRVRRVWGSIAPSEWAFFAWWHDLRGIGSRGRRSVVDFCVNHSERAHDGAVWAPALATAAAVGVLIFTGPSPATVAPRPPIPSAGSGVVEAALSPTASAASTGVPSPAAIVVTVPVPSRHPVSSTPPAVATSTGSADFKDTYFTSETASPSYATDHTLFASGTTPGTGCPIAVGQNCPVLARSTDDGHTWTRLPAAGFVGGRVLTAPALGAGQPILATTPLGLQQSDDQGRTFRLVVPLRRASLSHLDPYDAVPAAVGTDPTGRRLRVVLGGRALSIYWPDTGTVTPGPLLPATVTGIEDVGLVGARILVAVEDDSPGLSVGPNGIANLVQVGPLLSCDSTCVTAPISNRGSAYLFPLQFAPTLPSAPTTIAVNSLGAALVSRDGGRTYEVVSRMNMNQSLLIGVIIEPACRIGSCLLLDTIQVRDPVHDPSIRPVMVEVTGASTAIFTAVQEGLVGVWKLAPPLQLRGTRMVAGVWYGEPGRGGFRCSDDSGRSWGPC